MIFEGILGFKIVTDSYTGCNEVNSEDGIRHTGYSMIEIHKP